MTNTEQREVQGLYYPDLKPHSPREIFDNMQLSRDLLSPREQIIWDKVMEAYAARYGIEYKRVTADRNFWQKVADLFGADVDDE
ncbi:hypothetical protein A3A76_01750 [Candidatus Woesebacteria bacterium RIFCSPLOWO2_01_FULL_39_23]|uniref:Uncharacterized protein n=1 Tax=Candidatus Woesebacteria bacterium RIFCSPHIGHO2_01_FULL_40_22 TaxID=1802499 RepID=A0A1F7YEN5_9BACT|nr:MAG: hypothetical protein A2141_02325 [Candidatus Woesebacteria bacterium RBG_16_40_11]OGM25804.1 MAG: hypothetical protein A2628_00605 [Candidatus Woesebacteria bacterium RIFCSPHIGHO2_01_FULL_40_22]OGM36375.1 MAG: hypothetical protein A3E41_04770 [Candidatus Woesebacteria bacterium RIFCSPHIGHO2_12_FULL_38_9]OGM61757.1 MAG: hypothetical protein A3A76_01750 [Candidatus Woesebacteria bacterium RIFCSPLOWO2_01_FULL_39_23]